MTHDVYDALVNAVFANPERMVDMVRRVAPRAIAEHLDFATLALAPGILPTTKEEEIQYCDLLFSVQAKRTRYPPVYVLVEFLLTPDPMMPLRILGHEVAIWQRWTEAHDDFLPLVIPVILYLGPKEWHVPREFAEGYDLPKESPIREHLLNFPLFVDEVSSLGEDELRARPISAMAKLALVVLRHTGARNLLTRLERWDDLCHAVAVARASEAFRAALAHYVIATYPRVDRARLRRLIPWKPTV